MQKDDIKAVRVENMSGGFNELRRMYEEVQSEVASKPQSYSTVHKNPWAPRAAGAPGVLTINVNQGAISVSISPGSTVQAGSPHSPVISVGLLNPNAFSHGLNGANQRQNTTPNMFPSAPSTPTGFYRSHSNSQTSISQNTGLNLSPVMHQTHTSPVMRFATQLQQLQSMGFFDPHENIQALTATNGNINAAIELLLR